MIKRFFRWLKSFEKKKKQTQSCNMAQYYDEKLVKQCEVAPTEKLFPPMSLNSKNVVSWRKGWKEND